MHYRFDGPPSKTLDHLAQRGLFDAAWKSQSGLAWPTLIATPALASWAVETACAAAHAIADVMPHDSLHEARMGFIRMNFESK